MSRRVAPLYAGNSMGLFSRRKEVQVADFVCDFYNEQVFESSSERADETLRRLREHDEVFTELDPEQFREELLALRFEVTGTAWTHGSNDDTSLTITDLTRAALDPPLWEAMGFYNEAVAKSANEGAPKTGLGRASIVLVNKVRADLFDAWHAKGDYSDDVIARVANRFGTEAAWKSGTTQGLLTVAISRQLGLTQQPPDGASCSRIGATGAGAFAGNLLVITGSLYEKARRAIKEVKIVL